MKGGTVRGRGGRREGDKKDGGGCRGQNTTIPVVL